MGWAGGINQGITPIVSHQHVIFYCALQGSLRVAFDAVWSALADEQRAREQELNSAMVSKVRSMVQSPAGHVALPYQRYTSAVGRGFSSRGRQYQRLAASHVIQPNTPTMHHALCRGIL